MGEFLARKQLLNSTKLLPLNARNKTQLVAIDQIAKNEVSDEAGTTRRFRSNQDTLREGRSASIFRIVLRNF